MSDSEKWTAPSADEAEEIRAADQAQQRADARSVEEMRAAHRFNLQVDVSLRSEDNFFQGFSENSSRHSDQETIFEGLPMDLDLW